MTDYYLHSTVVVDKPCTIGVGSKVWHFSHLMRNSTIGENCNIGQNVVISPNVTIGNSVKIQNNVSVYTGVKCEDGVFLGPAMVFTNIVNPRSEVSQRDRYVSTIVRKGATIGANATILCGITIGRYAFIGAGAVVTADVPDFALIVGNQGKQIGWMSESGQRLYFNEKGEAFCKKENVNYLLKGTVVSKVERA